MPEKEITIEECADLLEVSTRTVCNYLRKGYLKPVYHAGWGRKGKRLILLSSVKDFVKQSV